VRSGQLSRHQTGAPGQRHSCTAVTVVVDEQLVVKLVWSQHEPRVAVRPQPNGRSNDTIPGCLDGREPKLRPRGDAAPRRGVWPRIRRAAAQAIAHSRQTGRGQERPTIHVRNYTGIPGVGSAPPRRGRPRRPGVLNASSCASARKPTRPPAPRCACRSACSHATPESRRESTPACRTPGPPAWRP